MLGGVEKTIGSGGFKFPGMLESSAPYFPKFG
jgi:hypothetical protein